MSPRVEWLTVSGDPDAWRSLGLVVTDDGHVPLYGTSLRIVAPEDSSAPAVPSGITGWTLSGTDVDVSSIDGLSTSHAPAGSPVFAEHALGAIGLDHVVVDADDQVTSMAIWADNFSINSNQNLTGDVVIEDGRAQALGEKLRLVPGHCDPTVDRYDWYVGVRGGKVEVVWPVSARGKAY